MEDVTRLTKEEFLKFLNCSNHRTKPERISVPGPKNSLISVVKRFGKFTADDLEREEFSLNHQILRVPLPRIDLQSLSARQVALKFRTRKTEKKRKKNNVVVSRFGRKLKKKQLNIQSLTRSAIRTRSSNISSGYATRSIQKNKNKPVTLQKKLEKKPIKSVDKKVEKKVFLKRMENVEQIRHVIRPPKVIQQPKPHFIIKYVPSEPTYFLKMHALKHPQDGKLKYPFDTLVKDIKNMKLPSATWKIKVVVKSNKIASIIFTNKCVLERTVTFNAKSEFFEIVIENRPAILLGSPAIVSCIEDIETLLNIIHTISDKNPMVYYKNN